MRVVVAGREYPLGDITRIDLGEQRMLKRILGVPIHEMGEFDPRDPDVATAMVWLALHRNRGHNRTVTIEQVERLHPADIDILADPEEEEPAGDGEASPPPSASAETPDGGSPSSSNGGSPTGSETTLEPSGHLSSSTGSPT